MELELSSLEFIEKPIEDLAKLLPVHLLSHSNLSSLTEHLNAINDEFRLFAPERFDLARTLTVNYVSYTSPRGATQQAIDVLGSYLLFWFWLNQAKKASLVTRTLDAFTRSFGLDRQPVVDDPEVPLGFINWLTSNWLCRHNLYRFLSSFESMVCAMIWEIQNWDDRRRSLEFYDQVRVCSIGTQPWFDAWRGLARLGPPRDHGTELRRAEYLARRVQYLANDLCSIERDLAKGGASVILLDEHLMHGLPESILRTEHMHDAAVANLVSVHDYLQQQPNLPAEEKWYAEYLLTCTAGNALGMANVRSYYRRATVAG